MRLVAWLSGRKRGNFETDTPVADLTVLTEGTVRFLEDELFREDDVVRIDVLWDYASDSESESLLQFVSCAALMTDWVQWVDRP